MYISSSVLKTSDFSRVRSTNEDSDVFNSRDEIYIWYLPKKSIFLFDRLYAICETPTEKGGAENAKTKILSKSK